MSKRVISSLMLLLVVVFNLASTTLFLHIHHINERTIVHSHPFSGSAESHSHSTSSLDIIARQAITEALAVTLFSAEYVDDYVEFTSVVIPRYDVASPSIIGESLRAPPVA